MDFWQTIRGVELAETLIRNLPKLTAKKIQRIMAVDNSEDLEKLQEALKSGERVVTSISVDGHTHVVLEKDVR